MIVGIGIDICEITRFEDDALLERFSTRFFSSGEWTHISSSSNNTRKKAETMAGIFAAKEAAIKALNADLSYITSINIEYLGSGAPTLMFTGKARERADGIGVYHAHVSITHDANVAAAVVVLEGKMGR